MTQKTFDGQTATFLSRLIASFPGDLTGEEMQKCIDDTKGLRDAVRAWVRPIVSTVAPGTPAVQMKKNILTVQPQLTTLERIALGSYDWKNSDITDKRFPHDVMTVGEWEYDLYHPDCDISSDDAKSQAEVDGWIVAKAEHLLAYGQQFPEVQRKFPVIALGSVCRVNGPRRVLALWSSGDERRVYLSYWGDGWLRYYRFLRVRKVQQLAT